MADDLAAWLERGRQMAAARQAASKPSTFEKLRDVLARLDAAGVVADMDMPGFKLHPLKGDRKGFWAVTVRANWRVIFRFDDGDAQDADYIDYH